MKRLVKPLFVFAAAALVSGARPAVAGIVVYENGNVIQGTIDPKEVTDDSVTVHDMRVTPGGPKAPGRFVVPRSDIRWFDTAIDGLADGYFDKYSDKYLDPKWQRVLVFPKEEAGPIKVDITDILKKASTTRVTRSWLEGDLSLRAPTSATWTEKGEVARFDLGSGASIHVYSTPAAGKAPSTQLEWVEQALTKLAGTDSFERDETAKVTAVPGGHDARIATRTKLGKKTVRALRHVCFRERRTYFVTCFAPEAIFDSKKDVFQTVLDSVRVDEGEAVDLAQVEAGQVWRWRSAARADSVVWTLHGKEPHSFRYSEALDGQALPGERTAPARLDPRSLLIAATRVPATPHRTGAQTLDVSGVGLECEVYEASAEGKNYKLWISKKFPAAVKLTVDGVVFRELVEIKR